MIKQEQMEQKIIDYFNGIFNGNLQIINARDFSEQRQQSIFVVGIEQISQVNYSLPDYAFTFSCVLDVFIDNDRDGKLFSDYTHIIRKYLYDLQDINTLKSVFNNLPVVGYIPQAQTSTITDDSNRLQIKFIIYTSEIVNILS